MATLQVEGTMQDVQGFAMIGQTAVGQIARHLGLAAVMCLGSLTAKTGLAQEAPAALPEQSQSQSVEDFVKDLQPGTPVQVSNSIWVGNVENMNIDGQHIAAGLLSKNGVSILVQSESATVRTAVLSGAALLEQVFTAQNPGQHIKIGVVFGTDPDAGDPRDIELSVYADGMPTNYSFAISDFNHENDVLRVTVAEKMGGAYMEHIVPLLQRQEQP
jgi:hypothetical protein